MKDFTIVEDFPKSEIEFDLRFSNPSANFLQLLLLTVKITSSASSKPSA